MQMKNLEKRRNLRTRKNCTWFEWKWNMFIKKLGIRIRDTFTYIILSCEYTVVIWNVSNYLVIDRHRYHLKKLLIAAQSQYAKKQMFYPCDADKICQMVTSVMFKLKIEIMHSSWMVLRDMPTWKLYNKLTILKSVWKIRKWKSATCQKHFNIYWKVIIYSIYKINQLSCSLPIIYIGK